MKVLFIGNSHTFVQYVPARVGRFCGEHGVPVEAVMLTYPGVGLDWHLRQSQTYFNLCCGSWDAVILQHNAHPFPGREELLQYGKAMAALVPEGAKTYLYMPWSAKDNPGGQAEMTEAYEALGRETGAAVCPVGEIWWSAVRAHPEEEFYFVDGQHSSALGASLAAAVIGRTLLGLEITPEACFEDAKDLQKMRLDPRMIDLVMRDGSPALIPPGSVQGQPVTL